MSSIQALFIMVISSNNSEVIGNVCLIIPHLSRIIKTHVKYLKRR